MPTAKKKKPMPQDAGTRGAAYGYRSGLEETVGSQLFSAGIKAQYEEVVITYCKPVSVHKYTTDFVLPNGIFIETKGRFLLEDRKKHLLIKAQHPDIDVRFVFSNSKRPISKGSKTTYAAWCVKHGYKYADKLIPSAWLTEADNQLSRTAIENARLKK